MPLLLDLFCKAGGCSMGYHRAGFEVTGVDIEPQPNYPFTFIQADALTVLQDRDFISQFDVIHASPPCQAYSWAAGKSRNLGKDYPDLLQPTRAALLKISKPYVIENVVGAPLRNPMRLCGTMFGLGVQRHRLFESNYILWEPGPCQHKGSVKNGDYVTVAGHGGDGCSRYEVWCNAMGINWMTKQELTQAIPPAYTEWIGSQLLRIIERGVALATQTS